MNVNNKLYLAYIYLYTYCEVPGSPCLSKKGGGYRGSVSGFPWKTLWFSGKAFFFCFPGYNTSLFRFSAEYVSFFRFSATFLVLFRLSAIKYNAPSKNKVNQVCDSCFLNFCLGGYLWTDQRIPGPVSCRCPGGSLETPPRWHATISLYFAFTYQSMAAWYSS